MCTRLFGCEILVGRGRLWGLSDIKTHKGRNVPPMIDVARVTRHLQPLNKTVVSIVVYSSVLPLQLTHCCGRFPYIVQIILHFNHTVEKLALRSLLAFTTGFTVS